MGERFKVESNGCGGWAIWDTRKRASVGGDYSHRSNAEIAANRLNYGGAGEAGGEGVAYWRRFYGAGEG